MVKSFAFERATEMLMALESSCDQSGNDKPMKLELEVQNNAISARIESAYSKMSLKVKSSVNSLSPRSYSSNQSLRREEEDLAREKVSRPENLAIYDRVMSGVNYLSAVQDLSEVYSKYMPWPPEMVKSRSGEPKDYRQRLTVVPLLKRGYGRCAHLDDSLPGVTILKPHEQGFMCGSSGRH
ncbi:hypothetical protein HPP92_006966 [Vanilla planifolia]|uniref:Uncharacterized protein n=1 Tax=Vanilla planifolia TaxID=51239 RepID=A0A835R9P8_VANPL|nr:hypothetical protein HPP92_007202 [Vanilla planifolia]KAG0490103.1 hypothetical protein HPP92_006966 [Vanilla planifolia]